MNQVRQLRLLAGYHIGLDIVERLARAATRQEQQRKALEGAADEIERLQSRGSEWRPIGDGEPEDQRVLVVRKLPDGARYVDVMSWVSEPESGLPPLVNKQCVTHWMPFPDLP